MGESNVKDDGLMDWDEIYRQIDAIIGDESISGQRKDDGVRSRRRARIIKLEWKQDDEKEDSLEVNSHGVYDRPLNHIGGRDRRHLFR